MFTLYEGSDRFRDKGKTQKGWCLMTKGPIVWSNLVPTRADKNVRQAISLNISSLMMRPAVSWGHFGIKNFLKRNAKCDGLYRKS